MSHYRKEYAIGAGGMGKVYRAIRTMAGSNKQTAVACKIVKPTLQDPDRYAEMFRREAELTIGMRHPGVIEAFECIEGDDGTLYLMMELVEGVSVGEIVDSTDGAEADQSDDVARAGRGRLTFDMVRVIAVDVLAALAYVHDSRVLHRDISPDNVLIARDGTIKLADFGVAKKLTTNALQSGTHVGKIAYLAPEATKGSRIDGRADLFSFAAMMYELLTGSPPFGSAVHDILRHRRECKVAPLPADVPEDLRELVMGLLVKEPDERIAQTAREAIELLQAPVDRAAVLAELGAMSEEKYRAKCARAEEHRRKLEIQHEAVPELLDGARPVVDGWADTPAQADIGDELRPVGEDGTRTHDAQEMPEQNEQEDDEANGNRWVVHRPGLAVATLAALLIAALFMLTRNGHTPRASRTFSPVSPIAPDTPVADRNPSPTRQDIDGIGRLCTADRAPEHAEFAVADTGNKPVERRPSPKPSPAPLPVPTDAPATSETTGPASNRLAAVFTSANETRAPVRADSWFLHHDAQTSEQPKNPDTLEHR